MERRWIRCWQDLEDGGDLWLGSEYGCGRRDVGHFKAWREPKVAAEGVGRGEEDLHTRCGINNGDPWRGNGDG